MSKLCVDISPELVTRLNHQLTGLPRRGMRKDTLLAFLYNYLSVTESLERIDPAARARFQAEWSAQRLKFDTLPRFSEALTVSDFPYDLHSLGTNTNSRKLTLLSAHLSTRLASLNGNATSGYSGGYIEALNEIKEILERCAN